MIRAATLKDVSDLTDFSFDTLSKNTVRLAIDRKKIKERAVECISSNSHFCEISVRNGKIVAALTAMSLPLLFHKGLEASVIQWVSTYPGDGVRLLRRFNRWIEGRKGIKHVCFTLDSSEERMELILNKMGYNPSMPVFNKGEI